MPIAEQKLTGYPSIDKPWLKYYSEEAINSALPECTIYEYLWQNNKDHLDDIALNYFDRKITYGELFENIDKAACAFSAIGVKPGDIVSGISVTTPEIVYSFYALNKIGAVSNWLDPRKSKKEIYKAILKVNSNVCLLFEDFFDQLHSTLVDLKCKVILISIKDSLPSVPKAIMTLTKKKIPNSNQCIPYKDFALKYQDNCSFKNNINRRNQAAILEYTGGTTGIPKAVMLSDENVNTVVEQYRVSGTPLCRNESWLTVAFPFVAYALIISLHAPLSFGMTCYLCFGLKAKDVEKMLIRKKINHMANTPLLWDQLISSKKIDNNDLSFLINPTVGADSMDVYKEKKINEFLKNHGCKYPIIKGYGMTEVGSAASVNISNEINKIGSVGIPFNKIIVSAFDMDNGKEVSYNQQGEICITGPSVMLGYYNNSEETEKVLRTHEDGKIWMHSGDLGHIDEDGFIYIDGRIKRMIIDHDGFKIFSPAIEAVLSSINTIEKVCVVGINDNLFGTGQIPVGFVVAKKSIKQSEIIKQIKAMCNKCLPEYSHVNTVHFVDELPYTGAGKVDYSSLEKLAERLRND